MTAARLSGFRLVTVLGPTRRIDLALAADVAVVSLLPSLLDKAGLSPSPSPSPSGWSLVAVDGRLLRTHETLADHGVRDGDTLVLRPVAEALPPPAVDDVADALVRVVNVRVGLDARLVAAFAAVLAFALGAAASVRLAAPHGRVVASLLGLGVALVAAACGLIRRGREPVTAILAGAVGLMGVTSLLAGSLTPPWGWAGRVALACASLGVALAGLAVAAHPWLHARALGAGVTTLCATTGAGALTVACCSPSGDGACLTCGAAVVAVLGLASMTRLPALALRLAGASAGGVFGVDASAMPRSNTETVHRARAAAALFDGAASGASLAAGAAGVALAFVGGWDARALGGVVGAVLACRVFVLLAPCAAAAACLGSALALGAGAAREIVEVSGPQLVALAAVIFAITTVALCRIRGRPQVARWVRWPGALELVGSALLVPLAASTFGLSRWVVDVLG